MKVAAGQRWKHVHSGDERTVVAIVTYREASGGYEPTGWLAECGVTHVAIMIRDDGRRDRRDSSDMLLIDGEPYSPRSWELLGAPMPAGAEPPP